MKVFAKFDEIPSMILEVIKETKRYGPTDGRSDKVKTVYPPTNTVCGGYNEWAQIPQFCHYNVISFTMAFGEKFTI